MRRLGTWLTVLLVFALVGAGCPSSVSRGAFGTSATEQSGSPLAGGQVEPEDRQTGNPEQGLPGSATATVAPAPPRKLSVEDASAILARLKTPESHTNSSDAREIPVQLPKRIIIPAIDIDAGFEFVGLSPDGAMDVPRDPSNVAWYQLGPRPGEVGNAVVAGHVDWGGRTAVFWRLGELKPGDVIQVVAADTRKYEFVVQWQRWYDADRAPVDLVFGQSGDAELTLITCGGNFDRQRRQYLSRLVVRARLR